MKKSLLFALAFITLAACSKTEINTPPTSFTKGQFVTISASSDMSGATKVTGTSDGSKINFKWESGDKILVKVGEESAEFTLKSGAGTASATFQGTMPADGNTFDMQYPVETPDLSSQDYVSENQLPKGKMLFTATGCTLGSNAELKAQYAVLQLNINFDTDDDEYLKQIFVSEYEQNNKGEEPPQYTELYTLNIPENIEFKIPSPNDTATFYIVVTPGTYGFRLSFQFSVVDGELYTDYLLNKSSQTFVAGECINMPVQTIECFAAGTRITLADGSTKKVEDIVEGDMVLTFDHETGCISSQRICLTYKGDNKDIPLNLEFASGNTLSIVGTHDLLFKDTLRYVRINRGNVKSYVGKQFYNAVTGQWDELASYAIGAEAVEYYCIYSAYHLNCIAEGMLTCPDDVDFLLNIYELDANLKADSVQLAADIQKYGLWNFAEDFPEHAQYASLWDELLFKYKNISKGKGLVTKDQLYDLLEYWKNE